MPHSGVDNTTWEEFMPKKEMEPQSNEASTSNHDRVENTGERNKLNTTRRKPSAKCKRRTFSEPVDLVAPNINGEKAKKKEEGEGEEGGGGERRRR